MIIFGFQLRKISFTVIYIHLIFSQTTEKNFTNINLTQFILASCLRSNFICKIKSIPKRTKIRFFCINFGMKSLRIYFTVSPFHLFFGLSFFMWQKKWAPWLISLFHLFQFDLMYWHTNYRIAIVFMIRISFLLTCEFTFFSSFFLFVDNTKFFIQNKFKLHFL